MWCIYQECTVYDIISIVATLQLDKPSRYSIAEGDYFNSEKICVKLLDTRNVLYRHIKVSAAIINPPQQSKRNNKMNW